MKKMDYLEDALGNQNDSAKRNKIFCAMIFVLCLRHVLQLLGASALASYLFIALYGLVSLFVIEAVFIKFSMKQSNMALFIFFAGAIAILFVFAYVMLRQREHFEASLTFVLSFPLIICCDTISLSRKDSEMFFKLLTAIEVVLVALIFVPSSYKDGILLLYTPNANQAGLLYMSVFLAGYVYKFLNRKGMLGWLLLAGLLVGCWLTESRAAFASCIVCILTSIIFSKKSHLNRKAMIVAVLLFIFIPMIAVMIFSNVDYSIKSLLNDAFTGRIAIWNTIFENIEQNPISLNMDKVLADHYGEELGAHNVWLDIMWKYSLPVAVAFLAAMIYLCHHMSRSLTKKRTSVVSACFVAAIVHMTFEAALIGGALDYTLYFLVAIWSGIGIIDKGETEHE